MPRVDHDAAAILAADGSRHAPLRPGRRRDFHDVDHGRSGLRVASIHFRALARIDVAISRSRPSPWTYGCTASATDSRKWLASPGGNLASRTFHAKSAKIWQYSST